MVGRFTDAAKLLELQEGDISVCYVEAAEAFQAAEIHA